MLKKLITRLLSLVTILTLAVQTVSANSNGGRRIGPWFGVLIIGVPTAIWIYMIITGRKK